MTRSAKDLPATLQQFDGKHVAPLEAVAPKCLDRPDSMDELISLSRSDALNVRTGATWLIKWLLENGVQPSRSQAGELIRILCKESSWEPRLHLLQSLTYVPVPARQAEKLLDALRTHTRDDNKFVRAWACNALCVLGDQHEQFRAEVSSLIEESSEDPAASVKARIRNLRKKVKWLD